MGKMYFAKMNVNEEIFEVYDGDKSISELTKKVFSGISSSVDIHDEFGGRIKFFDLDFDTTLLRVTGNLGYIKKGVHSSYDPETDDAIDTTDDNKIEYISFYFDVQNEILAYMSALALGRKKVLDYFERLIKKGSGVGVVFIQAANITDIQREILRFQRISKLVVRLVPPNGDKKDFEELASLSVDRIQESNATKIEQSFQTQRKAGIKRDSALVQNYIKTTGLGYSELKFSGKDKTGNDLEISSNQNTPYTRNVSRDQVKNHTVISEVGEAGVLSILKNRTEIALGLKHNKTQK
ncbi:DUF4747 family protein [Schleiferilactobacillus harbinensis]|jgi:hypothetical protein|uniref:DUF4747 family protein n=1 Tax=Schleiferilactobacillus harbinensis TaxID=304207 RepID=UPI0026722ED7|nr:DUF4747 family protein [Schleiferilactobacillus harbinensis]